MAKDVNLGINLSSEGADDWVLVLVDARVWQLEIHLQLLNQGLWVVNLGNGGNIAQTINSVVWHELHDLELVKTETNGIGQRPGQVGENLLGSNSVVRDKYVVERVQETNLDFSGVRGRLPAITGRDDTWNA